MRGVDAGTDHHLVLAKLRLRLNRHVNVNYGKFSSQPFTRYKQEERTPEEQLVRWKEHFEQPLNRPPPENPPDILPARNDLLINPEPRSKEEIAKATQALESNKAAGPDLIPPEALKADIPTTANILYGLFVNTWEQEQEQLARWKEHFEQLLNRLSPENPPDILPARNDLPIHPEPPSKEETAKTINALKSNKAAGPDLIPPEAPKADIPTTVDILYGVFENICEQEKVPCEWKEGHLIKLP
ncbi:hypothetical protein ElyMa_004601100 [Elysia marginata]|uniref:Uncharacterized protein n=1 Tax=Elysia marginata TaxID=1093978 RepID=A0AAV4HWR5_9GAST|nr:hypothetical protein ElyMa_004601100 [Elysia marginata]